MKSSLYKVGVVVALVLATALFQIASLIHTIRALNEFRTKVSAHGSCILTRRIPWRSTARVAHIFDNNDFHIISDKKWEKLQVKVIKIDNQSDRAHIISMQQQLHCLNVLRVAYLSYHASRPKLENSFYSQADMCIEQIRQHLMCSSDITLDPTELALESNGKMVPQTNGTAAIHRCRDWRGLDLALQKLE